jgi:hypothetical protein
MAFDVKRPRGARVNHHKGIAKAYLARKREEAVARQEVYAKKTSQEILEQLNRENYRAERQRRKLAAKMASEKAAEAAKKETKGASKPRR